MKREVCPNCGGTLVDESLGWRCKSCRGFISLQDGKFYEYVEKPFMSPMTNADRIRAMSDEELALELLAYCPSDSVFKGTCLEGRAHYSAADGQYYKTGHEAVKANLDWLQQPVKEET